jgi:hypothetical protein
VKYMLLMCASESVQLSAEQEAAALKATKTWVEEMSARGVHVEGDRLRPPSEARTLRVRGGEMLVTDGPFAETRELIAGYDILECADIDEAVEVASRHPFAEFGTIEVRPFWPLSL